MTTNDTPLARKLKRQIRADGPISLAVFMTACLHDAEYGYYTTGAGLGRDFTTSPEISQIFGELLGLWAVTQAQSLRRPDEAMRWILTEIGPGRGVLMEDARRAILQAAGGVENVATALVEPSPELRKVQSARLGDEVRFFEQLCDVPDGPTIILANEFLDCLPVRQFVRDENGWHERVVGLSPEGALMMGLVGPVPAPEGTSPDANSVEQPVGMDAFIETLRVRFQAAPGRAVLIDYGPSGGSPTDSLRAFRDGRQVEPLTQPGLCDLTADVDFGHLARLAREAGLAVEGPMAQGEFLGRLGIERRMQSLIAANPSRAEDILLGAQRLVDPDGMGQAFQVICLSSPDLPPPKPWSLS